MVDPAEPGDWYGVHEAAALLGVSVSTLRRRLKLSTVTARREQGRYGAEWQVWVAQSEHPASTAPGEHSQANHGERGQTTAEHGPDHGYEQRQADQTQAATTLELVRLVARLQEENRNLAGQVGYLQGQVEQMRALPAGTTQESAQEGQQAASPGGVASDATERASPAARRPWWRIW